MRTTLTLDPDLAAELKRLSRLSGAAWKDVVNETIRKGLAATPPVEPSRYETPVSDPGPPAVQGIHGVHELLAIAEGDDYR
ncbi:MAG: hypothetical protein CME06_15975 [Gemmatimonadetes bacterium]|nr:hypothetical protein [Gemmatimonadota bacterium]